MKKKNAVAKALFIAGIGVAVLGFFSSLLIASDTGNITILISGGMATAIATVVIMGFSEIVDLLHNINENLKK